MLKRLAVIPSPTLFLNIQGKIRNQVKFYSYHSATCLVSMNTPHNYGNQSFDKIDLVLITFPKKLIRASYTMKAWNQTLEIIDIRSILSGTLILPVYLGGCTHGHRRPPNMEL